MNQMDANTALIIAALPDYMREDAELIDALTRVDYTTFRRVSDQYRHPDDQSALTAAWNPISSAAIKARGAASMRCSDCGAFGRTYRGLGIDCGCAAE